ncbi:MAG: imidazole glycerol phosphate synthase subunit HisH [Phycisphaerae bacterium]|nr:imidazole glycerol phosphate synthase subunit HisH [Phycisphaerae bacterium]
MIAIIDCESSDTQGLRKAFDHLAAEARVVRSIEDVERASKIVIPNSSSFSRMIRSLRDARLVAPLLRAADDGRAVLGISHGMHLFFDVSHERGQHTGLGLIHGKVTCFDLGNHPAARHFLIPHRGWNEVHWTNDCPLSAALRSGEYFYFDHASYAEPLDEAFASAKTNHGLDFCSLIWKDRIFGTQFLPEKSEEAGLRLLANFAGL